MQICALWHVEHFWAANFPCRATMPMQVLLVCLIYLYLAMASRESLLLLNGSNIRPWWIWHHYLSALTCIIVLTLPVDSTTLQQFMKGWLQWTVLQGILMILQNMCVLVCSRDGRSSGDVVQCAEHLMQRSDHRELAMLMLTLSVHETKSLLRWSKLFKKKVT
jgi:TMPIT-like protein